MFSRIRNHMSFANVTALLALFVALTGTAYAAVKLPRNSVGAAQIKKNGVRASEVRRGAVGTSEVRNGSLRAGDFNAADLPGPGPQGPKGDKGDQGDPGPQGTFGAVTVQYEIATANLTDGTSAPIEVTCPAGQTAIGGGARGDTTDSEYTVITSSRPLRTGGGFPTDGQDFQGWRATVLNPQGNPTTGGFPAAPPDGPVLPEVWAICATPVAP